VLRRDPLANPERLIQRVYSYVAYRLGNGPEAEDVTSEVFERALRYRDGYDASKGEPLAWLLGIARRCVDTAFTIRPDTAEEAPDQAAAGDLEQDAVRRIELAEAVGRLDPRAQELVALRYGADLTAAQIAKLLDMRPNAVEVALHRALGRLRELLAEPDESTGGADPDEEAVRIEPLPAVSRTEST
jgi:RNA polymerase sigma-70 factor, ECF subfamily